MNDPRPQTASTDADHVVVFPASFAQQRLWLVDQLSPNDPVYNVAGGVRLRGRLDRDALVRALLRIAERHESLRTTFRTRDGRPVQVVHPSLPPEIRWVPIHEGGARTDEGCAAALAEEVHRPFDLRTGPLFRVLVLETDHDEHVLALTLHHVAADGWSVDVLLGELSRLYDAFSAGDPDPLPPLPLQYADYSEWQLGWVAGGGLDGQLAYWRAILAAPPAPLDVATDRSRPRVMGHAGERVLRALSPSVADALRACGAAAGATPFMVYAAAYALFLSRLSRQPEVVVGTPVANRNRPGSEGLVGCLINLVALRVDLRGDVTFRELLERVRGRVLEAQANQDVPFEHVVAALDVPRDPSRTPLLQTVVTHTQVRRTPLALRGLDVERVDLPLARAKFDLTCDFEDADGVVTVALEYRRDLFDASTAERMLGAFGRLLEAIAETPDARTGQLPLLSPAERRRLVALGGDGVATGPARPLAELFEGWADRTPGAVAVRAHGATYDYAALDAHANRVANRLIGRGVRPAEPVALLLERSFEAIASVIGVLKAGATYVPLEPAWPAARIGAVVADSGARIVLSEPRLAPLAAATGASVVPVDGASLEDVSAARPAVRVHPSTPAYVIYTSGSTGTPKGVLVGHDRVVSLFRATDALFRFGPADRFSLFHSLAFDFSVWETWGALLHGGAVVVVPSDVARSPAALLDLLREEQVTVLSQTPAAFFELAAAEAAEVEPGARPLALREVVFGGDKLDVRALAPFRQRHVATPRLVNLYGITETTVHVTAHVVSRSDLTGGCASPIGAPLAGHVSMHLLDEHLEPVPVGVPGEICVGGSGVAAGYAGRAALTAERFVPDPFASRPGATLYRSGDLARRLPDGAVEYLGRLDSQVKVRGFRIELGEVEAAIARSAGVREVRVVHGLDARRDARLVAYVVLDPASDRGPAELRAEARALLPDYMVPGAFVVLARLPLTANGKLDRAALPEPARAARAAVVAPSGELEVALAEIWQEVLGVDVVGADDDFFELGGHSLHAARLAQRVRARFGVTLPLRTLFEAPTLADTARTIGAQKASAGAAPPPVAIRPEISGDGPLASGQQRIWMLERLAEGVSPYHVPVVLRARGPLDPERLAAALTAVAGVHEALRTSFPVVDGRPVQRVHVRADVPTRVVDLSGLPEAERDARSEALVQEEALRPFVLAEGPLVRLTTVRLAPDEHLVLLTLHHVVCDGWSMDVLLRDLAAAYAGGEGALERPARRLVDFARDEAARRDAPEAREGLAFWKRTLDGAPSLDLPTDRPRPAAASHRGGHHARTYSPALLEDVAALAASRGATPFMALLAAWAVVLHRLSGEVDVCVGTPVANRGAEETDRLVGCLVNTLALRLDVSGEPSFLTLLDRVREVTLDAFAHEQVPFDRVVDALGVPRDASRSPVFQTMLVLQNTPLAPLRLPGGVELELVEAETETAKLDLMLALDLRRGAPRAVLEYATDLFDAATAGALLERFGRVLERVVERPHAAVASLDLLSSDERGLLAARNDTREPFADVRNLAEAFALQVARSPGRQAVAAGGQRWTYGDLDARVTRVAQALVARGVGLESRVGVLLERSVDLVATLQAVVRIGAAYVPLDPQDPPARTAGMADDAACVCVVTTRAFAGRLARGSSELVLDDLAGAPEGPAPSVVPGLDHLAYVLFTSGSTGKPKGAMIDHRAVANRLRWMQERFPIGPGDRILQKTPFTFDVSVWELFWPLTIGAELVLLPPDHHRDPAAIARSLAEESISIVHFVPSMLEAFLRALPAGYEAPELHWVVASGEELLPAHVDACAARLPRVELHNLYGPTEAAVDVTAHHCRAGVGAVPIGRPVRNVQAHVLDARLAPVPPGVAGELYLGGVQVGRGYAGRPEATADRFVPDVTEGAGPGARLYRTGDRARWNRDGELEYLGRLDAQVKLRGQRIELGEIEAALREEDAVRDAVAALRGEGAAARIVAWVVPTIPSAFDEPALRAALGARLPAAFVPSRVVALDRFPLTSSGKLDRRALPEPDGAAAEPSGAAPRTAVERVLARVWVDVLGVEAVSVDDDFFEIGGNSLLAMQALAEAQELFHREFSLRALFERATIACFADEVARACGGAAVAEDIAATIEELSRLSPEELAALDASASAGVA